uniref:Granulin n=1 Tax=Strongyloides stercoralis TaxID=6248 RepID=A0A0K0DV01_STRER
MIFFNRYIVLILLLFVILTYSRKEECDDTQFFCPTGDTCCQLGNTTYGCCPMPLAVCCSDHEHCCPHNTICNKGRCYSENKKSISGIKLKFALLDNKINFIEKTSKNTSTHMCDDKMTECFNNNTCCKINPQGYGCCPLKDAVCCSDRLHCCPQNSTCIKGKCLKNNDKIISGVKLKLSSFDNKKFSNFSKYTSNNLCDDKKTVCPDDATCCLLNSGMYGCCPFEDAVCCNDHYHCCPFGFKCNLVEESCEESLTGKKMKLFKKINGINIGTKYNNDVENVNGSYNCCPSTQKCNILTGKCVNKGFVRKNFKNKKIKATKISLKKAFNLKLGYIQCYDSSYCTQEQMCCRGYDGFGHCCPKSQGKCDPSGYGCYESDYTYDANTGKAVLKTEIGEFYTPIINTTLALKKVLDNSNVCNDGTICENNQTCCPYEDDSETLQYRCCPFKNGDCCRNSCCAPGYMCTSKGECLKK